MLKRSLLLKVGAIALALTMFASFPLVSLAKNGDESKDNHHVTIPPVEVASAWPPALPPSGMAAIYLSNYNGNGDALDFDIGNLTGTFYQVAAASNSGPGQGEIFVAPGTYNFTASSANLTSVTKSVTVQAGEVLNLRFTSNNPETFRIQSIDKSTGKNETVGSYTRNQDLIMLAPQDITAQAK